MLRKQLTLATMNGPQHIIKFNSALNVAFSFDKRGFVEVWDPMFDHENEGFDGNLRKNDEL